MRQNTARVYADWRRTLERAIGKRRMDPLSGQDIRDCFLSLMKPDHDRIRFPSAPGAAISASKKSGNDLGIGQRILEGAFEQLRSSIENDRAIADAVEELKKVFFYEKCDSGPC